MCGGGNVKSITHNIQQMSFQTKQQPFSTTALCQKAPRTLFSKSPRRWLQWYFWSSQRETQFNPAVHTMHVLLGSWMSTKKKSWTLTTHDRYLSVGTNHLGRRSVFAINIHCSCTILSCFHIASTKGAKLTADYPNTMQHDDHSMVPAHHSHTTHTHIHTPTPIPPFGRYMKIVRICTGLCHTKSGILLWRAGSEGQLCTKMYR